MSNQGRTRREFTRQVAALTLAPLVARAGKAQAEVAPQPPGRPGSPVEALTELLRLRYGRHLSEEQLQSLRHRVERNLRNAEALRRTPLLNSDEPCFVFTPDVP